MGDTYWVEKARDAIRSAIESSSGVVVRHVDSTYNRMIFTTYLTMALRGLCEEHHSEALVTAAEQAIPAINVYEYSELFRKQLYNPLAEAAQEVLKEFVKELAI